MTVVSVPNGKHCPLHVDVLLYQLKLRLSLLLAADEFLALKTPSMQEYRLLLAHTVLQQYGREQLVAATTPTAARFLARN